MQNMRNVNTEDLISMLAGVVRKKTNVLTTPRQNLRVRAILEATLQITSDELLDRQKRRKRKWEQVKSSFTFVSCKRLRTDSDYLLKDNAENEPDSDFFGLDSFFNDMNLSTRGPT